MSDESHNDTAPVEAAPAPDPTFSGEFVVWSPSDEGEPVSDRATPGNEGREVTEEPDIDMVIRLRGRADSFRCECGCNVFRRVEDGSGRRVYRCNGCRADWVGER